MLQELRAVTEEDRRNLLTVSYSKLDTFTNCQYRYKKTYVERKVSQSATLPLELGTILHKGLEMKGNYLMRGEEVDYGHISDAVMNGCDESSAKSREHLYGVNEIKSRYRQDWMASLEDKENMSYPQKIDIYLNKVLPSRMQDEGWEIVGTEIHFNFVYDNRCIFQGFIDRVDKSVDEEGNTILRVVDYKSSKKVFEESKLKTPLQMVVYDLACQFLYGILPTEHEYDFILLDKRQSEGVCTRGYFNRGLKKIDSILDKIDEISASGEFAPSPTPLCYWCPYADKLHTPNADPKYAGECPYYSLWTPNNKVFKVNQEYVPGEEPVKRKLVF